MKLHTDLKFRVQVGEATSQEYARKRRLRQGDAAAGILCIKAISFVYSDAQEDVANHPDDPIKFKEALYADDAAISGLASKLKRLQAYILFIIDN